MTGKTSIEWATAVWNPTTGCTRVSDGCTNCYAFALHDKRYASNLKAARDFLADHPDAVKLAELTKQSAQTTVRFITRGIRAVLPWPKQYDLPFSRVQLLPDRLDDPLRHKKPERYFVDSMADLFHEDVPDGYIAGVWMTMLRAGWHDFLVLTKRPERMRDFVTRWYDVTGDRDVDPMSGGRNRGGDATRARYTSGRAHLFAASLDLMGTPPPGAAYPTYDWMEGPRFWPTFPAPNVWLGTSVEDQAAADERIPHLLATPAAVRFLSCEPLIGPVDLRAWMPPRVDVTLGITGSAYTKTNVLHYGPALDWVIVGGESGPRARPMDLAWARSLVAQCRAAGVAPFVKQLGSNPYGRTVAFSPAPEGFAGEWTTAPIKLRESHGRDMAEWPLDLQVRAFPGATR